MKATYDSEADAAYISLVDVIKASEATQQVSLIDTPHGETQATLDFDTNGCLLGIEILAASRGLRQEFLDHITPA
ncbi:DUF2283 domain-containing protein [Devriesea agamarum]|uniref:DUF2283 domain-containing protein n=1 Tax=Devriesea agamarum TaxID=472569 RepID=UPI00071DAC0C|nr:DUF2283 domain-containing protein [Devriesea agamarum]